MNYFPWPECAIPANATATGKYRHPNGIYALYHGDGSLRFLCRLVSGQVDCWLNLSADGRSGHLDQGNTGEAYYQDGRMETFSPWDDSAPFKATEPFEEWRTRAIAAVSRPVPADAPQSLDLELADLRASCRKNFADPPGSLTVDDWRMRFLGFLRRFHFGFHGSADSLADWTEAVRSKAQVPAPWDRLLIEELPICAAPRPGLWKPDWSGLFAWKAAGPSWLLETVAAFRPKLEELGILRSLAAFPGPGTETPVCRLRGLIFACELLCLLGEGKSAIGMARNLEPLACFQPERLPWSNYPEELEMWQLDWETCAVETTGPRHRRQITTILERMAID